MRLVAVAIAALAASCGDAGSAAAASLVVDIEQSRSAQVRHVLEVRLVNEGETPLEVISLQLIDPRFTQVPANPKTTPVEVGGAAIETPIDFGEAVCEPGLSASATVAVVLEAAGRVEELVLPVEADGNEVLGRIHGSQCRQRAVAQAVAISFGPDWETTAPAVARGEIVLERAASDQAIAIEQVAGTVIFSLRILGGTGPDVVALEEGEDRAAVEVEVSAARCDPHALIESKKTYSFPLWVRLGDGSAEFTVLEPEGRARAALERLLTVGCDVAP